MPPALPHWGGTAPAPQPLSPPPQVGSTVTGVPVAEMDSAYVATTGRLLDKLTAYASFEDPADPERIKVPGAWGSPEGQGGTAH